MRREPLADGSDRRASDQLGRLRLPAFTERCGRGQHRRIAHRPAAIGERVLRGVDFTHSRVHRDPDALCPPVALARVLGHREQGVDRQHRLVGTERQALGDRARRAQPGECARPTAERDRVELAQRDAGPREQREDRRDQRRRSLRAARGLVREHLAAHR